MAKTGKRLTKAYEGIDPEAPPLAVDDAVKEIKKRASAKFDETVEIAMNLNLDPRKPDQNLRGTVMLPHGTGKSVRVGVFARGDRAKEAEAAGADVVGAEDLVEKVQAGEINFDRAIATPDMIALVGRPGQILGQRCRGRSRGRGGRVLESVGGPNAKARADRQPASGSEQDGVPRRHASDRAVGRRGHPAAAPDAQCRGALSGDQEPAGAARARRNAVCRAGAAVHRAD